MKQLHRIWRIDCLFAFLIYAVTLCSGCDSASDGPTAEELLQAKRQRESEWIAKANEAVNKVITVSDHGKKVFEQTKSP